MWMGLLVTGNDEGLLRIRGVGDRRDLQELNGSYAAPGESRRRLALGAADRRSEEWELDSDHCWHGQLVLDPLVQQCCHYQERQRRLETASSETSHLE